MSYPHYRSDSLPGTEIGVKQNAFRGAAPLMNWTASTKSDPDALLMLRLNHGDIVAFEELVKKYKRPIMNFVSRILGDSSEAEDVAQTAFLQVFKAADRFDFTARFSTWLYAIARNRCLHEIRRRSRHASFPLERESDGCDDMPQWQHADDRLISAPEALFQQELQDKIEEALAALPEKQRMAILLLRNEEISYKEIAAVMRTSLSTTKMRIHHGRKTLKRRLKPWINVHCSMRCEARSKVANIRSTSIDPKEGDHLKSP